MAYDWGNAGKGALGGAGAGFSAGGPIGGLIGGGLGLLGGFLGSDEDPAKEASKFYNQIPGQTSQYYQPFFEAGKSAIPTLQDQYKGLIDNPAGKYNDIAAGYKASPGYKYALEQALAGSDRAAAAGGYSGLPQHSAESEEAAEGLASKDFNNYLQQVLGQYGLGLQGEQSLYQGGVNAGGDMAKILAETLAQKGNLAFKSAEDKNAQNQGILSSLFSFL